MATYAIGDVQGCYHTLQNLLKKINFSSKDSLWFAGDLVNRGPRSLEVLRFIKQLSTQQKVVLGNHDLHLLALAHDAHTGFKGDTLNAVLNAPDRPELIAWLQDQPLLVHDEKLNYAMTHAGLAPAWDLATAKVLAKEVSTVLTGPEAKNFFKNMYGNQPNEWHENLTGWDRLRCITNYFTRLRFCDWQGRMDLEHKGTLQNIPAGLMPWFKVPHRQNSKLPIVFGHWAALAGTTDTPHVFALDTGCVWGYTLTAMRLEDGVRFQTPYADG